MWSAKTQAAYLSLTAHFVWAGELRSAVLASTPLPGSHTAVRIASCIEEIIAEWNCREKVSAITTYNGANVVAAVSILGFRHVPCVAHTINLVVNDALSGTPAVIDKCKRIVTYFRSSNVATDTLGTFLDALGNRQLRLIQSVCTRWNSSLDMVERMLEIRDAVTMALLRLPQSPPPLSGPEIEICKDAVEALKPFKTATTTLSGDKYPTASLVVPLVQGINDALYRATIATESGDLLVANLRQATATRLHQYEILKATRGSTYLDHCFKRFGFCCENNALNAKQQVEAELRQRLGEMEQADDADGTQVAANVDRQTAGPSLGCGLFDCVRAKVQASKTRATTTSLSTITIRQYSERSTLDWTKDAVKYWTDRPVDGPDLAHIAEKYLTVPATSVPSERVFSAAGQVVSERRNRLNPKKAGMLIFLNQIIGFIS